MLDLTMSLANRTAVYDIGQELCALVPNKLVRYWRVILKRPIEFNGSPFRSMLGKALSRGAFRDLSTASSLWPRRSAPTLFIDPIFSLRTPLEPNDIVLCHDIAPVSNPEYYDPGAGEAYSRAYTRIQEAKLGMVFVSEFTKNAFLARYPAPYRFTKIIPLYHKPSLSGPTTGSGRSKPFILMVGGMEKRKNFRGAIEAFKTSRLADLGYELLLVGPRGNLSAELLPIIESTTAVSHLGYLSDTELAALYSDATALFFPSFLEGFGVPALEAPKANILPIVSRGTVLEEIVGPSGPVVDPTSIDDMARGLREVIRMPPEEKMSRLARISQHQRIFSIERFRSSWADLLNSEKVT